MGSDRQSIALHENGKKHLLEVQNAAETRREDKVRQDRQAQLLASSLKSMEQAAALASANDARSLFFSTTHNNSLPTCTYPPPSHTVAPLQYSQPPPRAPPPQSFTAPPAAGAAKKKGVPFSLDLSKKEKNAWQARKQERHNSKEATDEGQEEVDVTAELSTSWKRQAPLGENEGHYGYARTTKHDHQDTLEMTYFLEGTVYAPIMEEDMSAQLWTGPRDATMDEKRAPHADLHWITCLIVKVRSPPKQASSSKQLATFDVAYLTDPTNIEQDETIDQSVPANRIRLVIGSDDDLIPSSVKEARLLLMGGEEQTIIGATSTTGPTTEAPVIMDEQTGLSSWGTVSVRTVTVHQEEKEERARARLKRREEARIAEEKQQEARARTMEEAKHANADDSALGAYQVFGTNNNSGYKGVNIHTDVQVNVQDTAKSLSKGKGNVAFKTRKKRDASSVMFQTAKKKQNRRTTYADDD